MKKSKFFSVIIGALFIFASCSDENGDAKLSLRLTDAPADFEEVLIDIQEVRVNMSDNGDESGWISLDGIQSGVYNLLDLTNGMDTVLAEEYLPVGTISQIRLVLGENNKVKKNGEYFDIKTPSAQQSGLKLNVHAELEAGITYRLWLDFDAGRSIVEKGNGTFSLKPVIRTFTEATSGAIKGMITPVETKPYVYAISSAQDTFTTYADTITGYFFIRALPEGDYQLKIEPIDGYQIKEIDDVEVTIGNVADVGEVVIDEVVVEEGI